MTEAAPKIPTPPSETEKFIIPTDEEEKKDTKQLILLIMGYCSLVFIVLALFFPFWNWFDVGTYHYISLWQATGTGPTVGIPFDYWTVFFTFIGDLFTMITNPAWPITSPIDQIIISLFHVNISIILIIYLIRKFWKRTFPKGGFFWVAILFGVIYGVGFPLYVGFSFGFMPPDYYIASSIYGPKWGFAFGWWALFIGSVIAVIRKLWLDKIDREEKEKEDEGITFKV